MDTVLLFRLWSAPKIFDAIADAIAWIMVQVGGRPPLHYLDDFLFCGHSSSGECEAALQAAIQLCEELGVPLSTEKLEGPGVVITFLDIELDTQQLQLCLPAEKLQHQAPVDSSMAMQEVLH